MARRRRIESNCPFTAHGYHIWWITHHSPGWDWLTGQCIRCHAQAYGQGRIYDGVQKAIDDWWHEHRAAQTTPSPR